MTSFLVDEIDLFDSLGKTQINGSRQLKCKVATFESSDSWGEFESPGTIRIHSELSKRDALVVLFHEAAHALWEHESLGKKEDEETVCGKIAEGLARMVIGNSLEPWIAEAKSESWEIPCHLWQSPREALALDCEGIEKAVAANRCVRQAPMDYQPWDMRHGKPRNRYHCRLGVKAVRKARERVKLAIENDPPHLWYIHFEMLEVAEYSLRVRLYWRNGERSDFDPSSAVEVEREHLNRVWYGRVMEEWDKWSRREGPTPSKEAMYAAMGAMSLLRSDYPPPTFSIDRDNPRVEITLI